MPCDVIATPHGPIFACRIAEPCAFCGDPAPYRCDWPATKRVKTDPFFVLHGDTVILPAPGTRGGTITAVVRDIYAFQSPGHRPAYDLVTDHGTFRAWAHAQVSIERQGTCDAPVCEDHVREVAEDRHYCQEHWNAWREVD
jgi:hypothetical protein